MKELSRELRSMVENQELLRLAYTSTEGYPRVVPLWYALVYGEYYCGTYRNSAKWKAIQKDPRVGWVIDGGDKEHYKGVSLYGHAEEATGQGIRESVYRMLGEKYFGTTDDPKFKEIYGEVDDESTVYFHLIAEDGLLWEY
jgi:nitroimidazol reductase NimA-like FMN-containing flavoprotein (pyridoxamine 5'-phosphate oxidase superfamily)